MDAQTLIGNGPVPVRQVKRMRRNVTQEKLAELADLNIRTLQKIEAGETNILVTTAVRLRRALGCPWEVLLQ